MTPLNTPGLASVNLKHIPVSEVAVCSSRWIDQLVIVLSGWGVYLGMNIYSHQMNMSVAVKISPTSNGIIVRITEPAGFRE